MLKRGTGEENQTYRGKREEENARWIVEKESRRTVHEEVVEDIQNLCSIVLYPMKIATIQTRPNLDMS
jgi:hypothetical protein